jgi:hypothetical protein
LTNPLNNQGAQGEDPNATRHIPSQSGYSPGSTSSGPNPHGHMHGSAMQHDRQRSFFALLLIGAGVLFLLQQLAIFRDFGDYFVLMIGVVFMYAYFSTRAGYRAGFLIPGAILLGIGTGQVVQKYDLLHFWQGAGNISGLTLGLGFCLIWALERRHWWALIPGGILVASSLSDSLMLGRLWPLALIMLGVYLLYEQNRRGK